MKHKLLQCLMLIALLLTGTHAQAHDFEAQNSDGVTIYYNITSSTDKTCEVTYRGSYSDSYSDEYTGSITIPETVTYYGTTYSVTSIGGDAFRGCTRLTSITIPNSVTSIGSGAFKGCSGLTYIELPGTLTSIGDYAFSGYNGTITRTIKCNATVPPAVGQGVFSGNYLTIEVPFESVLDYKAVEGWTNVINGSIKYKGKEVEGLYYMPISENEVEVTYKDTNYKSYSGGIVIPAEIEVDTKKYKVTRIGYNAFYKCSGLTSITIPNSVTSIGSYAFYGCI